MPQLLLETATDICSVAVARDGEIVAEVTATEKHHHASHLTLYIQTALERAGLSPADLEGIVLSDGPGSYTSLRVGAATAKGLCLARPGLTLRTVPTLLALAAAARPEGEDKILATLNSRRGEVFGQLFSAGDLSPLTGVMNVQLTDPRWRGKLLNGASLGRILVCGPGQERVVQGIEYDNAFRKSRPERCAARYLLSPAAPPREVDVAGYEPLYLNPPFVTQSKKKSLL